VAIRVRMSRRALELFPIFLKIIRVVDGFGRVTTEKLDLEFFFG
jgi:hypothetical protein